ncbi:NAD(P)-binding protein [Ramaria rubella]|nr:NAD(P)-binding protein [Ramaria rubella]
MSSQRAVPEAPVNSSTAMSQDRKVTLRWGIIGCGGISRHFVEDLLVDPTTRNTNDVEHRVVAAGSRTIVKAEEFIKLTKADQHNAQGYGTYEQVYANENIDIIYVGTPHTYHYENTRDALLAGKHVLCEKPFTSNAAELRDLIEIAKKRGLFLMEAMWTRFQPIAHEVKKVIDSGELGDIRVLHADLSGDFDIENIPTTHRILDPNLGGGALLDLGPYPFVWSIIALYEHQANNKQRPSSIAASILKTPLTGVDSSTSFTLTYNRLQAQAILSCSITLPPPKPPLTMRFRNGNIIIQEPIYRPMSFTVQYFSKPGSGEVVREETREFIHTGRGHHYMADAVARSIRDGKTEHELWNLETSLFEMEVFDEVRRQGEYKLPPGVEKVL